MNNYNRPIGIYHGQAEKDIFAEKIGKNDLKGKIIEVTMQQIMDAYDEFIGDLMQEAQEAY